ncbi:MULTISPECIES: hypothetical protein [unclassified Rhodococcus (in: high G+C Gram-positive bacteria)]|uniref:hypothetical protein n=1 Tax=unclassified Rhodococcus (in: high G+C Gram-positive bacteria) TaxID=192944 RepID=UPI00163B5925|nr:MULTISPECIES: hypothetical protein [unclassified Rhodococcus (in: high G+C Gram-positive bacteria)]MBC2637599.1 hypothetical protein [Rhodococcus sp. 3A]MBC2644264.1 hypothetical protein [Rhodococcus sp. 3A]MBC2890998.1 hypothetical protein [Rhodococcus sp. 4CII]MBC2897657.1 hypothetical protein [Rhodococcus sp. 4CII]
MTTLFVLDVEDFTPLAEVAAKNPDVTITRRGPYLLVSAEDKIIIDRNATGCRNAVWFSSVAALSGARITTWDKTEMIIEPTATATDGTS